ncbi:MAG: hypothetical protein Q9221_000469 [Calogaya cf. arnoldii]
MDAVFRQIERAIESQPMPAEYLDTKASVYCNDCNAKSSVKYHWLGLKCGVCDSYNTATIQIVRGADQRTVLDGLASTSPASGSRIMAVDETIPSLFARPIDSQNLEQSALEDVTTDHHRDSIEAVSEGDYSDVDFWGLESPNARGPRVSSDESAEHDSSDDDDSQGDANVNDCTAPGDTRDNDDDDDDDDDTMEIFGHR